MRSKSIFSAPMMFAATIGMCVATMPSYADTFTWTGGGADKNWSTGANWSPAGTMTASDTANFQTGTLSTDTINYDSGAFAGITVQSGAWTANVASASFTGKPITVAKDTILHLILVQYRGPKMANCELVGEKKY